jgi:hypothetical protein
MKKQTYLDASDDGQLGHERPHVDAHAAVQVDVGHSHAHSQPLRYQLPNAQRHGQIGQRIDLHTTIVQTPFLRTTHPAANILVGSANIFGLPKRHRSNCIRKAQAQCSTIYWNVSKYGVTYDVGCLATSAACHGPCKPGLKDRRVAGFTKLMRLPCELTSSGVSKATACIEDP